MFEAAELGHHISKEDYRTQLPALRQALLEAQYELKEKPDFPLVILINGVDGAGKGETVNLLNEWMDPRLIDTHAFGEPGPEALAHPTMWRYWQVLPAKGRIGILFGSWYTPPILDRVSGAIGDTALDNAVDDIVRFETMLASEGVQLLKFWFHLGKSQQRARLKALEKDPLTRWRVGDRDWEHFKHYDEFVAISERVLLRTSTGTAPWVVVDGEDERYRSLTVGKLLLEALRTRLDRTSAPIPPAVPPLLAPIDGIRVLDRLQLDQPLEKSQYTEELERWQGRLNQLSRDPRFAQHSLVAVFEGNDAAGKGGAIRRVTGALDARHYHVIPVAAPTEDERAQPYLWRFWRRLPKRGTFALFDRSWYGRVLVERIEGFAAEPDWMRAYGEINDFERQLTEAGTIVVKFWLAIDADEQLKRFNAREETGFKRFKITEEDWRNRAKWDAYREAVHDMVERTSTHDAPWTLVEANNKYYARIKVLQTICKAIENRLAKT
ncbi:polyphosphate:AMP phosphotransferase [Chitinimonas sp. BJYL2]|uniref:polyphosphate:AMP phosphotransferase n=1 Tax=Chitinimonas sp. BJYL2 TaxID=2976696 RepID=UPI0022B2AEFC|nr:polyphosphate:AMP phosphotransferase [Chitinimonas sp. BJYL2]